MADIKISALTDGGSSLGTDQFPIARAGVNFRVNVGTTAPLPVGTDSGTANAYVVTTVPNTVGLTTGASFTFQAAHANSAASTMNVNGTGVKNLKGNATQTNALVGGEILTGVTYVVFYDSVEWILAGAVAGVAAPASSTLDLTKGLQIPAGAAITLTTPALTSIGQARNMLNFICAGQITGCAGGQSASMGFDGDGVFVIGTPASRVAFLIGTNPEIFDNTVFLGNGAGAQTGVTIGPFTGQTSGNKLNILNPDSSNAFTIDFAGKITIGANDCTNASPAACGKNQSGAVAVAASSATLVVNTTAVQAGSQIILTEDASLGTKLGVTCNVTPTVQPLTVTARTAGTSFTFSNTAPVAQPRCVSYLIIN